MVSLRVLLAVVALTATVQAVPHHQHSTVHYPGRVHHPENAGRNPFRNALVCIHDYDSTTLECSEQPNPRVDCVRADKEGVFSLHIPRDMLDNSQYCSIATAGGRESTRVFKGVDEGLRRTTLDLTLIPVPPLYQDEWEVALHWLDEDEADTCDFALVVRAGDYTTECYSDMVNNTLCEEDIYNYMDVSSSDSIYSTGDVNYCSGTGSTSTYEAIRIVEDGTREFDIFVYAHGASNFNAADAALLGMEVRIAKLKKADQYGVQISGAKYTFRLADATFPDLDGRFWHLGTLEIRTDWSVTWGKGSLTATRNKVKCLPTPSTGSAAVVQQVEFGQDGVLDDRRC